MKFHSLHCMFDLFLFNSGQLRRSTLIQDWNSTLETSTRMASTEPNSTAVIYLDSMNLHIHRSTYSLTLRRLSLLVDLGYDVTTVLSLCKSVSHLGVSNLLRLT